MEHVASATEALERLLAAREQLPATDCPEMKSLFGCLRKALLLSGEAQRDEVRGNERGREGSKRARSGADAQSAPPDCGPDVPRDFMMRVALWLDAAALAQVERCSRGMHALVAELVPATLGAFGEEPPERCMEMRTATVPVRESWASVARKAERLTVAVPLATANDVAAHGALNMWCDEDFVDWEKLPRKVALRTDRPLHEAYARVARALGVEVAALRLWWCIIRENGTMRPDTAVPCTGDALFQLHNSTHSSSTRKPRHTKH